MSSFSESDLKMIERWKTSRMMSSESYRKDLQRIIDEGLPLIRIAPNGVTRHKITPRIKPEITTPFGAKLLDRMSGNIRILPLRQTEIRRSYVTRSSSRVQCCVNQHASAVQTKPSPSFTHCLTSSNLIKGRLTIPTSFWEKYLKKRYGLFPDVELRVSRRVWIVGLKDEGTRHLIQSGFKKISKDLSLSVGSVCKFDLVDSETIIFDVSIIG